MKPPVFYAEGIPDYDEKSWHLEVGGLVKIPKRFSLSELKAMRVSVINARLTSVSGWSYRADWEGVVFSDFLVHIDREAGASHVTFVSLGGYDSTVSLEDALHPHFMLCFGMNGDPLAREYGAPLRVICTHLWGYKSVKGLSRIIFGDAMKPGYWESRGYPLDGEIAPGYTLDINSGQRRHIRGGDEVTEF
jgi:DMSO/TMAO reductase YedYZ molybdopterin-dependent catalytic subunit